MTAPKEHEAATADGGMASPVGGGQGVETPDMRLRACCQSEPECVLCPHRPENAHLSLAQLWRMGLYARLPSLGFR